MKTKKTTSGTGTHAASFRISEDQHQQFLVSPPVPVRGDLTN
jgi:hypothetical protein